VTKQQDQVGAEMGDASCVRTRWKADPDAAFAAKINNENRRFKFPY
jgi:hypothetical protein